MIETAAALSQLDEILSVPGFDGVMVGQADLAASMGYMLDPSNAEVEAAVQSTLAACERNNVPFGIFTASGEAAETWVSRGAQIVTVGSDMQYIDAGIARTNAEVQRIRSARGKG